jgi:rhodanese-related sulfurtransferase
MDVPEDDSGISTRTLAARLAEGEPLAVLDVREPHEREYCTIPLADGVVDLHIPLREIPARLDEVKAARGTRTLVVFCHHGVRSRMVRDWLAAQGLDGVLNLEGGINAWSVEVDAGVMRY